MLCNDATLVACFSLGMREGYAWVGVSAQRVGIKQLNTWSPARYGTLSVEALNDDPQGGTLDDRGDVLSWDIFVGSTTVPPLLPHRSSSAIRMVLSSVILTESYWVVYACLNLQ